MKMWTLSIASLCLLFSLVPSAWGRDPGVTDQADRFGSVEERRLRLSLQEEIERQREKEEKLRQREFELKTLEEEVDKKIAQLQKLRTEVAALLAQKDEAEKARIKDLGKMYEKMDPAQAAIVLTELNDKLAVDILSAMKEKSAGRVLGNMNRERAAHLTDAYPELAR